MHRIHITGASGSGTTTLGMALAKRLGYTHLDADDYFWLPTSIPFTEKRGPDLRNTLLMGQLGQHQYWVLSGSVTGWGLPLTGLLTQVIYPWVPGDIRLARLCKREEAAFGAAIMPGGAMYEDYTGFIAWAARYDTAGMEQRSRVKHDAWLAGLDCPILRIEGDTSTEQRTELVLEFLGAAGAG